jgi:ribonuclease HI
MRKQRRTTERDDDEWKAWIEAGWVQVRGAYARARVLDSGHKQHQAQQPLHAFSVAPQTTGQDARPDDPDRRPTHGSDNLQQGAAASSRAGQNHSDPHIECTRDQHALTVVQRTEESIQEQCTAERSTSHARQHAHERATHVANGLDSTQRDSAAPLQSPSSQDDHSVVHAHTVAQQQRSEEQQQNCEREGQMAESWHYYTDGAWEGEAETAEAQGARGPPPPAGYGVAEFTSKVEKYPQTQVFDIKQITTGTYSEQRKVVALTRALAGQVDVDGCTEHYLGARKPTNNTGELSAVAHAMSMAAERTGHVTIHSDSLYAINMTTGKWMPRHKQNIDMISHIRNRWRTLQLTRKDLCMRFEHVRSHTKQPGNELADWLAGLGANSMRHDMGMGEHATKWIRSWINNQNEGVQP